MCGIAGTIFFSLTGDPAIRIRHFGRALAHRGPDGSGWLTSDGLTLSCKTNDETATGSARVLFVHRRLAILDLSNASAQPMVSLDGRFAITFNGEIYNYIELREQLAKDWRFRSTGDTEVFLAAYAVWGTEAFKKLVGMYAAAILDVERKTVCLVRDPFGIKAALYRAMF